MTSLTWHFELRGGPEFPSALRDEWEALAARQAGLSFIQCPVWSLAYRQHLAADPAQVAWLTGRRDGQLGLVLPLERRGRHWSLLTHDHLSLVDVLADAADDSLWPALSAWLGAGGLPGWGGLKIPGLADDAGLAHWLRRQPPARLFSRELESSAWLDCRGSHDDILKGASANLRSNLTRGLKKARATGELRYETHTDLAGLRAAMVRFKEIEASGWKGQQGGAIACDPRLVAFYDSLIEGFAPDGRIEIDLLWLDDRAIATTLYFRAGGALYLQKIAYSEDLSAIGPGRLIMNEAIRRACADPGLTRVSFITRCPWADGWRTALTPVHACELYRPDAGGWLQWSGARLVEQAREWRREWRQARQRGAAEPSVTPAAT